MSIFLKTAAGVLLTSVLIITVGKQEKDIAMLLSIAASCMVAAIVVQYLQPVLDFLYTLEAMGNLHENGLGNLLKIVGIGVVAEIASMVCQDAGNPSLGRQLQLLATVIMINLSLPFFEALLKLIENILITI